MKESAMDHGAFADQIASVSRTSSGLTYVSRLRPDGSMVSFEETMEAGKLRARVLDCVEQWARKGSIAPRLLEAANAFRRDYYDAGRTPRYVSALQERVDKSHSASIPISDRQILAGERVHKAMMATPLKLWDAVVAILCEGKSMIQLASETGRDRKECKGYVIAGLECLAKAYRL